MGTACSLSNIRVTQCMQLVYSVNVSFDHFTIIFMIIFLFLICSEFDQNIRLCKVLTIPSDIIYIFLTYLDQEVKVLTKNKGAYNLEFVN